MAQEIGRYDVAPRLLEEAEGLELAALDRARATWERHLLTDRLMSSPNQVRPPARPATRSARCTGASERARQELRATGESSARRAEDARDVLTPQELEIARMAASGLTNRAIGAQLYLSHRTVASHLYRVFPKLGITARSELAAALAGAGGD